MSDNEETKKSRKLNDLPDDFHTKVRSLMRLTTAADMERSKKVKIKARTIRNWMNGEPVKSLDPVEEFCKYFGLTLFDLKLPLENIIPKLAVRFKRSEEDIRLVMDIQPRADLLPLARKYGHPKERVKSWFETVFKGYWYLWNDWINLSREEKTPVTVKSLIHAYDYDDSSNTILVKMTTRQWYEKEKKERWNYCGWVIIMDKKCHFLFEDAKKIESEIITIITNRPTDPKTIQMQGLTMTTVDDREAGNSIPTATRVLLTKIDNTDDEIDEDRLIELLSEVHGYPREKINTEIRELITCELDDTNLLMFKLPPKKKPADPESSETSPKFRVLRPASRSNEE